MPTEAERVTVAHRNKRGTKFKLFFDEGVQVWVIDYTTMIGTQIYGMYDTFEEGERNLQIIKDRESN